MSVADADLLETDNASVKILFVDDEQNILHSFERLLMDEAFSIFTAVSGEEALDILKNNPDIGLIISDQRMPGMTGVELLERAREIVPDALRILLTGYADINAVADAINRGGAYRYITKPWKDEEIIMTVNEAAQRHVLIKENKRLQKIIKSQNDELKKWNSQLELYVQEQTLEIQKKNKDLEKLNQKLRTGFKNSLLAFSGLIEIRDRSTSNHSKNVASLSVKIAKEAGFKPSELAAITAASLLHDIGKIGMPDFYLMKDISEMDETGQKEYMRHPIRGQAAIDVIENLRNAGVLIRHHHERYDGKGFPDKLSGDQIPLGARIIALADFIDRTYRKCDNNDPAEATIEKAVEELGVRFDPALYKYMEKAIREVYRGGKPRKDVIEVELMPDKLKTGMILSRDVLSGTGVVLLAKGVTLNGRNIEAIRRYYSIDPPDTGIFIWDER